ncbi:MAG: recombinase zinc beta ribbon domain-containing protein [Oscillibacter sp.]|nr:recombinase zinc beta ribbon domain-containing protein [Oscillibacter sp.]
MYIGNLVQAKYKSVSYRSKKMAPNDKDRWTVIEHAHEAIISDEQFAAVHDRLALHPRVSRQKGIAHFLSGLVFCGSCGRRMTRCTSGGHARWRCPTRTYAPDKCQCPSFSEKSLCEIVLEEVQKQVAGLVDARDAIESARKGQRGVSAANEYKLALTRAEQEKVRLKDAKFQLYDSLQSGVIDQAEYRQFKAQYQEKVAEQDRQITMLHTDLDALKAARKSDDEFVKFFSDCGNIQTLDRAVVSQLIDRIVILDASHVEIYFKFSGASNKIPGFAKKTEEHQTSTCG